ncbi:MAG: phosphate ABC transporter permease subunit PstC [Acetobacteraceae bacterium]
MRRRPFRISPFRIVLIGQSSVIPAILLAVVSFLVVYAWPAIRFNGVGFLVGNTWSLGNLYADPIEVHRTLVAPGAGYGILFLIVGTLASSALAALIAVPVSILVAIVLAEGAPPRLRPPLSLIVEVLAVVPSVVYGLWGVIVLAPLIARLAAYAGGSASGFGLLTSALVLALMIAPIITATIYSALRRITSQDKEAAYALGAMKFEMAVRTMVPAVRGSIVGGVMLGVGRALGETMAVLMVSGGAINQLPRTLMSPISTMASFIVSQLDSAEQDPSGLAVRSLAEIALVLFIVTVLVNGIARLIAGRDAGLTARR